MGGLVAAGIYLFMNRASDLAASKSPTDDDGGVIPDEPKAGIAAVLLVECIGTFFWALTASMGDPLSVGCIITSMVYMGDHVSGGQYNPAVSLGTAIRFRAPLPDYLHVVLKVRESLSRAGCCARGWHNVVCLTPPPLFVPSACVHRALHSWEVPLWRALCRMP